MSPGRSLAVLGIALLCAVSSCRRTAGQRTAASPSMSSDVRSTLRSAIDSMAEAPDFSNAHWGILIVDPIRADTLYARNAGKLFMPASNMKILTSAAALAQLGPEFTYHTVFAGRGPIANGTLLGDLLVVGRGDPSVSDHMRGDAMLPLRMIADSLAARGIARVSGRVLAAGNAFPGSALGFGWTYDDLESSYSAPVGELLFNEGFSEVHVRGGERPGDPVHADVGPARSYPTLRVAATTARDTPPDSTRPRRNTLEALKDSATWSITLSGQIGPRDTVTLEVTHHDANAAYVAAVRQALGEKGITIGDAPADTAARLQVLATLSSAPMREILKALMKPSQNQIAEMLFRTVALETSGSGREDSASAVVQRQIAAWGVGPNEAVVRDGSGLSRYDYVSPRAIVRVLDAMRKSPAFTAYYDALPIAGVDGSLRNRMKGTLAEGNVRAKTGSLALARSLSGYATRADGHMLIFSVLANNWTTSAAAVERVQDAIAVRLAALQLR